MGRPRPAHNKQQRRNMGRVRELNYGFRATMGKSSAYDQELRNFYPCILLVGRSPTFAYVLADTRRSGYAQLAYTVTCSHLSCIRQIARKLPRVCQPLDSQLASQTYMYFIIEREHKLGYIHVSMQLCYVLWMKNCKSCKAAGAPPQTPMGELTALPHTP